MGKIIAIAVASLGFLPSFAAADSPLRLQCGLEQALPGRALVCEYTLLESRNAELADLHERVARAGRAARVEPKRWLAARDACRDVECLDRLYDQGMREAKLALVDVETRRPAILLTNARGELLRVVEAAPRPVATRPAASRPASPARERPTLEALASLLMIGFLVAALGYSLVARRLVA